MQSTALTCPYHRDTIVRDKFSPCRECVREFFLRHNIPSVRTQEEEVIVVTLDDIVEELDDILKEIP